MTDRKKNPCFADLFLCTAGVVFCFAICNALAPQNMFKVTLLMSLILGLILFLPLLLVLGLSHWVTHRLSLRISGKKALLLAFAPSILLCLASPLLLLQDSSDATLEWSLKINPKRPDIRKEIPADAGNQLPLCRRARSQSPSAAASSNRGTTKSKN